MLRSTLSTAFSRAIRLGHMGFAVYAFSGVLMAAPIPAANYSGTYIVQENFTIVDNDGFSNSPVPLGFDFDYSNTRGAQIVGQILTTAAPSADVLMDLVYPKNTRGYITMLDSRVDYYFRLNYTGTSPPPSGLLNIPVLMTYKTSASYDVTSGSFYRDSNGSYVDGLRVDAFVSFAGREFGSQVIYDPSRLQSSQESNGVYAFNVPLSASTGGTNYFVRLGARARVSNLGYSNVERVDLLLQAVADPYFELAPGFQYADLFSVEVSPGVNNTVVPIPAAVWLFGSALGLMGVMRRKMSS